MKNFLYFALQDSALEWLRKPRLEGSSPMVSATLAMAALLAACAFITLAWKGCHRWQTALGSAALALFALIHAMDAWAPAAAPSPIQLGAALACLAAALALVLLTPRMLAMPSPGQVRALTEAKDRAEAELRATATQLARLIQLEATVKAQTAELHESQARLLGFIHHASTAIAFKDLEGRFVLINPRYEALLGRTQAEILGRTLDQLIPPKASRACLDRERRVIQLREESQSEEEWHREGNPTRFLLSQKFPLLGVNGECWGLGIIITDITERKEAEQVRLQDQKLESLGILAGGLAHDFNNLLGAMEGNVELAKLVADTNGPVHPYLETLEGLIARSASLVRQILAYAGRGKSVVTTLDLNLQVEEMTRLLRASLSRKATLRLDPEPDLPLIKGDPAQIQQAIMNLVLNATEAVETRNGLITISTSRQTLDPSAIHSGFRGQALEPGPYVCLEVADDGPGMPAEVLERIFDPFYTTKFTGRGLGLSAVLGTLRAHQGGIQVTSEPGKGTRFRMLLPAAQGAELPEPLDDQGFETAIGSFRGSGLVLVVDDEEPIRATAVQALQRLGFETLEAVDGLEALQVYEANRDRIRLILMDLTMPRMDGEEAYRELRSHGVLTPVILTSGFCARDVLDHFQGKGIAGFLQKPYRLHALAQEVRRALGREALRAANPQLPLTIPRDLDMGCPMLDQQHRRLVGAFNLLAEHLSPSGLRKDQEKALAALIEVALTHFGVEETLMESLAYPRTREHQTSHARLINQINGVSDRIRKGTLSFSPALLDFLESWMVHHTQEEDKRLAQFLKAQGH
jgi:hemerythrin-like metal-binding protein/PAS domain S-box-containing protein